MKGIPSEISTVEGQAWKIPMTLWNCPFQIFNTLFARHQTLTSSSTICETKNNHLKLVVLAKPK
jgi:hypothetical protein